MAGKPELSLLIEQKMDAEASMFHARVGMEQAQQAYEFYRARVAELAVQIALETEPKDVAM